MRASLLALYGWRRYFHPFIHAPASFQKNMPETDCTVIWRCFFAQKWRNLGLSPLDVCEIYT